MSPRILSSPSRIGDCYRLARALRDADRQEVVCFGLDPRKAIRESYRHAILHRTYFVDGEIAAMGGLSGSLLSHVGYPYLMTTPAVERVPTAFFKECRKMLGRMLEAKSTLAGDVLASYSGACRMLYMLGFELGEPRPLARDGTLFRSFPLTRGG